MSSFSYKIKLTFIQMNNFVYLQDTIDWRPEDIPHIPKIRYALLKRLSKRCRNYKAELKRRYYSPYVGSPRRFICGDKRVDNDQWRQMVDYWDSDPANKVSITVFN